jgi:phosphoribosylformylglycinamidine cyclo-ligase
VLTALSGSTLESTEGTWNLGIGMFAVVSPESAGAIAAALTAAGIPTWAAGTVSTAARDLAGFEQGAKGVQGGTVRLVGAYSG